VSYASQQDLVDRFGEQELIQLTDRGDPPAGAVDATAVAHALADADAEIDSYLGRYTLPLTVVPAALERIACDIARYRLYEDRATEQVRARYDDALRFLRAVGEGKLTLGPDTGGRVADAASDTIAFEPGQKVFGREDL
jgi:phage gp36-like protein